MKKIFLASFAANLALIFQCLAAEEQFPTSDDCKPLYSSFFAEPSSTKRRENFTALDIDQKYLIYLCGNQKMHPPTIYLAEAFAAQGETAASFLQEKLTTAKSDATISDIIYVFVWMARLKTYDVKSNAVLMDAMQRRALNIKNNTQRQEVIGEIDTIRLLSTKQL